MNFFEHRSTESGYLKMLCERHIEDMVRFFEERHASDLEFAIPRWRNLMKRNIWEQTEALAMKLHKQAVMARQVCSDYLDLRTNPGAFILLSVAPSPGDDQMLRYFPHGDYRQFIHQKWQELWAVPDWKSRDFVHWMLLWDKNWEENCFEAHLFYLWSAKDMLTMLASQQKTAMYSSTPFAFNPPPLIYPEDFIPPQQRNNLLRGLLIEWMEHAQTRKGMEHAQTRKG